MGSENVLTNFFFVLAPNSAQVQLPPTTQPTNVETADLSIQKAMAAAPEPPSQNLVVAAKSDVAIAELISFD